MRCLGYMLITYNDGCIREILAHDDGVRCAWSGKSAVVLGLLLLFTLRLQYLTVLHDQLKQREAQRAPITHKQQAGEHKQAQNHTLLDTVKTPKDVSSGIL